MSLCSDVMLKTVIKSIFLLEIYDAKYIIQLWKIIQGNRDLMTDLGGMKNVVISLDLHWVKSFLGQKNVILWDVVKSWFPISVTLTWSGFHFKPFNMIEINTNSTNMKHIDTSSILLEVL